MTRKANRPEELWIHATFQQLADLREWIRSRMKRRHADSISGWLLSLGTAEPVQPHKRQLAFFRKILDHYGPPRPAIGERQSPPESPPEPAPPDDDSEAPAEEFSKPSGRLRPA